MKPKFNLMDCLIIVVLIVVIAFGAVMFKKISGAEENTQVSGNGTVEFKIEINNKIESYTKIAKVGDKITVGEKEKIPATVTDIEVKPYKRVAYDALNATASWQEVPERYTVIYTLETEGTDTYSAVTAGGVPIRVGEETALRGKGHAGSGYIVAVDMKQEG